MLFIKYVTDKYGGADDFAPPITIPKGASFKDMVALKGKSDIGDKINKQIIAAAGRRQHAPRPQRLPRLQRRRTSSATGKEMVERLTNLIAIFENPALDFSKNRAEGDDILGDAYEYLMRHFATESGKSKGQFYTPAEVSRIMAKVIGISPAEHQGRHHRLRPDLRLGLAAAEGRPTRRASTSRSTGRRRTSTTAGLARMNMILHDIPTANILSGQHAGRSQVQGRRAAPAPSTTSSPIRRSPTSAGAPASTRRTTRIERFSLRRAAGEAGRLRLPAAHRPLAEEHRQRRVHPAARRAVPRQCRGRHPPAARPLAATSRASSACPPTSSTAPASPPASSCSTRRTPPPARASS